MAKRLMAGEAVSGFENRGRCTDGSCRWLSWDASPLAEHRLILAVARGITERDAMPAGGPLTLVAENVEVDAVLAATFPGAKAGSYVRLQVKDTDQLLAAPREGVSSYY